MFDCVHCGKSFPTHAQYREHMTKDTEQQRLELYESLPEEDEASFVFALEEGRWDG